MCFTFENAILIMVQLRSLPFARFARRETAKFDNAKDTRERKPSKSKRHFLGNRVLNCKIFSLQRSDAEANTVTSRSK